MTIHIYITRLMRNRGGLFRDALSGMAVMLTLVACTTTVEPDEELVPDYLKVNIITPTKIVAHRGYWNLKGAAENSLASLDNAAAAKVYASEFDVRLTADSVPVICHDPTIEKRPIDATPYADIQNFKLPNGETLPTLYQYLTHAKAKNIHLFLEIKTTDRNDYNMRATRITVAAVEALDMRKQVDYIAFSVAVCREIIRLSPGSSVSYLSGVAPPSEIKKAGLTGMNYQYESFLQHPEWISEAHALGLTVGVWIVNDMGLMYDFAMQKVDYITTDKPDILRQILGRQ